MITTTEIICDLCSFLDKDQIERIQLVSQFWNNIIIRHKNIWPFREFHELNFFQNQIRLYVTSEDWSKHLVSYIINFDGARDLSKGDVSSRYSQLTVDEVLTNLNDVVYEQISLVGISPYHLNDLLNMMKLVTTKTGGRFQGRFGRYFQGTLVSKLAEILDNYIIVDELTFYSGSDSYIREVCANPEIVQLPSTPKEIRLERLKFKQNEEVFHFTCNGKLNGANRLTIEFRAYYRNYIRQWFELYSTHQNPISLVGKFEHRIHDDFDSALDNVKTFLKNTQLHVKYSLETKEFHNSFYGITKKYVKRSCVLHETDSYALVIEMEYREVTDMSSINASDLNQPPCKKMEAISLCVKSL